MEFFTTLDALICLVVGGVIGLVGNQILKGGGFGSIGNIVVGAVGGIIGGWAFDLLDFMNIGDYADPIIASVVGAVILLAIVGVVRR